MDRRIVATGDRRWSRGLVAMACAAAAVCVAVTAGAQGTPYLVKDIEKSPGNGSVAVRSIGALGARVVFAGNDGVHGFELWTSDGTEDGTKLVRDIQPGPRGSVITDFTATSDAIFFVVDDGVHGRELWTSTGTEASTHLVRDVGPGRAEGLPHLLTPSGELLFFVADDGTHGDELWVTDGSEAGTALVADVRAGSGAARIRAVVAVGGLVYFVANDGVHGSELWSTDGTPEGTALVADLRPGATGSMPADLVRFADGVLFSADDGATGRELWRADEVGGVVRVADIRPGQPGSAPSRLVVAGDLAYFTATTSDADGAQLWASNGTGPGTSRVSGMKGQWGDLTLGLTAAIGDTLYFVTSTDDGRGAALWRTEGTEASTLLVADLKNYPCSEEFRALVVQGDRLFLVARSYDSDDELWTSDGTPVGTRLVKDIFPGQPGGRPGDLAVAGDVVFFAALDGLHGRELWKSDGTEDGTVLVRDILLGGNTSGAYPYPDLVAQGDEVLFSSAAGTVWSSDGTAAGTSVLGASAGLSVSRVFDSGRGAVLYASDASSPPRNGLWRYDASTFTQAADLGTGGARIYFVTTLDDGLLYQIDDPNLNGGTLWRTAAGTTTPLLLRSFSRWAPGWFYRVRGDVYFNGGDWQTGSELWKTDGTAAGTTLVADINPGAGSAVFNGGIVGNLGRRVLIAADDGVHGTELFVTDGTPAGTRLLRDIYPGKTPSWPTGGGRLAGVVYFGAWDASGFELWRSDGTASGTYRLKDIVPGPDPSAPYGFARLGDVMLFSAYQRQTGRELWRTDGTADGTWLLADAQPGREGGGIIPVVVVGDVAYFVVEMPNHALQLWLTDGTPAGTRLAADVSSGAPGAGVKNIENRSGQLFFVADDGVHGSELWALTCGDGAIDELEECDDGAQNGSVASCCSGACGIRPGAGAACDPIEATLEVRRARVQYDGPGPATTGRITLDGQLDADAAVPLSLASGLTASFKDGGGFTHDVEWAAGDCTAQASGVPRCARSGAVATFRPVAGAGSGAQRYRFAVNVSGLDVSGPLTPAVGVKLRTGDRIDRAGQIEDCVARRSGLVCRP